MFGVQTPSASSPLLPSHVHWSGSACRERSAYRIDPQRLISWIGARFTVEARHGEITGVMQSDELPLVVEDRTAGAAWLGWRSVMQTVPVIVE